MKNSKVFISNGQARILPVSFVDGAWVGYVNSNQNSNSEPSGNSSNNDSYAEYTTSLLRFNGNTNDEFNNTVTVVGTPSFPSGQFGQSMTGASISLASNYSSYAFVAEGWFKMSSDALLDANSYNPYNMWKSILFGFGNGIEPAYGFDGHLFRGIHIQRWPSGNTGVPLSIVYKGNDGGGGYSITSPSNGFFIDDNQWHHIAMVRGHDDIFRLYIDGNIASSGAIQLAAGSFASTPQIFRTSNQSVLYDELRVTIGTDRGYTGSTIPLPSAIFPDPLSVAPSTPTNLSASSGGYSGSLSDIPNIAKANLSWSMPSVTAGSPKPSDYIIQYSTNGGSSWTVFNDGVSKTTSATITGLTIGTTYLFRVAATHAYNTGSYTSSISFTPAAPATVTILDQPKNNFSATSSDTATFSAGAYAPEGTTVSYQWQYYGIDWDTYSNTWLNISGATSYSLNLTPSSMFSVLPNLDYYDSTSVQLRCVITNDQTAATTTSSVARWIVFSNISAGAYPYGSNGAYISGSVNVGGITYSTMTMEPGETLYMDYFDTGTYGFDYSWYSSNAITVKIQVSDDATSWTDYSSANFRTSGFYNSPTITNATGQTKYYRLMLYINWPFTTTNGSSSVTKSANPVRFANFKITW